MAKKIIKFSIATAGTLHCINRYIESVSEKKSTKTSGKYYHWDQGDIFYTVSGNGKPVLLLHDLNIYSSNYEWSQIINKISETNTVYAIDLPGCGKSDKPAITYTNYFYVQMITDFIREVINDETTVITSGFSATFVIMTSKLENDLFNEIILINPPALSTLKKLPDDRSKILIRLFGLPVIGKTCYYICTNRPNTENYFEEKCFYNPFNLTQATIKAGYNASHANSGNGRFLLASLKGNYLNTDISQAVKSIDIKTTIIMGEHESSIKEVTEKYERLNDSIIIKTIPGTKKYPQLESPEKTLNYILDCIAER